MYPTSAILVTAKTRLPPPNQVLTITQPQTFHVYSLENTVSIDEWHSSTESDGDLPDLAGWRTDWRHAKIFDQVERLR